jgi:hypothetical protein
MATSRRSQYSRSASQIGESKSSSIRVKFLQHRQVALLGGNQRREVPNGVGNIDRGGTSSNQKIYDFDAVRSNGSVKRSIPISVSKVSIAA